MYINEINVQRFGARQTNVTIGNCTFTNASQWPRGSLTPLLLENSIGMKSVKVVLCVKGDGREGICDNVSKILSELVKPVEIMLDGFSHRFMVALKNHSHAETCMRRWHTLALQFEGYELGLEDEATVTGNSITIKNIGNIPCPCVLEILPTENMETLTIEGLNTPITIKNMTAGNKVVVNGETGLFTENGANKFKDMDVEEPPYLIPGETTITTSAEVIMTIKHSPMYI